MPIRKIPWFLCIHIVTTALPNRLKNVLYIESMSSLGRKLSQRVTKSFVTNYAAYLLQRDESSWHGIGTPTKIGNVYVYDSNALFLSAMQSVWLDGSNYLADPIDARVTLKDLGKDLYFGTRNKANLIRLRLVELPGTVDNSGEKGLVGYVYVEVNYSEPGTYVPEVGVSRT